MLLSRLAERGRVVGITHFVAEVLVENGAMLSVFRAAGYPMVSTREWGTIELTMDLVASVGDVSATNSQTGALQSTRVPPSATG
jgi:hypothetical protein